MELEITSKKENKLVGRTELYFKALHHEAKTPARAEVRDKIAGELGVKKNLIVIDNMRSAFGHQMTKGYAKIYSSTEQIASIERDYILKRNGISISTENKKEEQSA